MAGTTGNNPPVPDWLETDYRNAIEVLARRSLGKIGQAASTEQLRGVLCMIALWKGLRVYASIISDYSEEELESLLPKALPSW